MKMHNVNYGSVNDNICCIARLPPNITEQDQSETYNSAMIVCTFTSPSKDFLNFPFLS